MKIIRIESCEGDCPYFNLSDPEHVNLCDLDGGLLTGRVGTIPDWCPLEDAPSTEDAVFGMVSNAEMRAFNSSRTGFIGTGGEK